MVEDPHYLANMGNPQNSLYYVSLSLSAPVISSGHNGNVGTHKTWKQVLVNLLGRGGQWVHYAGKDSVWGSLNQPNGVTGGRVHGFPTLARIEPA